MAKKKINTIFNLLERKGKKRLREKPFTDEWSGQSMDEYFLGANPRKHKDYEFYGGKKKKKKR